MTHDPHTSSTLGRKLTPYELGLMANLYIRLARRQRRLERAAARYGEEIEYLQARAHPASSRYA